MINPVHQSHAVPFLQAEAKKQARLALPPEYPVWELKVGGRLCCYMLLLLTPLVSMGEGCTAGWFAQQVGLHSRLVCTAGWFAHAGDSEQRHGVPTSLSGLAVMV